MSELDRTGEVFWNVDDVMPLSEFEANLEKIRKATAQMKEYVSQLHPDMEPELFGDILKFLEETSELTGRTYYSIMLRLNVDQENQHLRKLETQYEKEALLLSEVKRPFWLWIIGKTVDNLSTLDDANAQRLFAIRQDLLYFLDTERLHAKHSLDQHTEEIMSKKAITGFDALNDVYTLINNDMRYRYIDPKTNEERVIKTRSEVSLLLQHNDRAVRKAAYEALTEESDKHALKLYSIYQNIVKDRQWSSEFRHYDSAIQVKNIANDLPDDVVTTMLDVCTKNKDVFHRFFTAKAKLLNLDRLQYYDIHAPVGQEASDITYPEAVSRVLDVFSTISPGFAQRARRVIDEQHIDSHPRVGKEGGAFNLGLNGQMTPYIKLNFTGKENYTRTIAHELGHAVHSMYAEDLSVYTNHAGIALAETASTFAENVFFDAVYAQQTDVEVKKYLLAEKISDSFSTILVQANVTRFELQAYKDILESATLDQMSELHRSLTQEITGDAVVFDDELHHGWLTRPHIFQTPFYCYGYSFGLLLSLGLYDRYKKDHSFFAKIEGILAAGGSRAPVDILKEAGIDLHDAAFWQEGFTIIQGWIDEFEALVDE